MFLFNLTYLETGAKHVVKKCEYSVAFRFIIPMDCFCSNPQLALYGSMLPKLLFSVPFSNPLTQNVIDWFVQQSIHLFIKLNPPHHSIYPCIHLLYNWTIQSHIHRSIRPFVHPFSHSYIHPSTHPAIGILLNYTYDQLGHQFTRLYFYASTQNFIHLPKHRSNPGRNLNI